MSLELIGLLVNIFATIAGFFGLMLKFENRMTRVETRLDYWQPKTQRETEPSS